MGAYGSENCASTALELSSEPLLTFLFLASSRAPKPGAVKSPCFSKRIPPGDERERRVAGNAR